MKILNILIAFLIVAMFVMPALAATGEDGVKIIGADGKEKTNAVSSQDTNDESKESESADEDITGSDGFNKLLSAPIKGVDYLLGLGPTETLVLWVVGIAIGGSIVLTIISFAVNNGRISWGSIFGKYQTMLQGRNWMAFVFLGFLGFLFALALMKFLGTTSIF